MWVLSKVENTAAELQAGGPEQLDTMVACSEATETISRRYYSRSHYQEKAEKADYEDIRYHRVFSGQTKLGLDRNRVIASLTLHQKMAHDDVTPFNI